MSATLRLVTRLLAIVALPLGLFLVGCAMGASDEAISAGGPFALPPCSTDANCSGGAFCMNGSCVPAGPETPEVLSIELDPPDDSGYARTQVLDAFISELAARGSVELPVPTEYETEITDADNAPISANLAIFGTPRIPGRELDVNATVVAGASTLPVFRLLEGSYVVRIRPTSSELPGMEINGFSVRPQPGRTMKQFALPASYRRLYGEVTSSLSNSAKLAGVTVRAFGEKSGLPSTVSVTDEDGSYELLLPASEDTTFRLLATPPGVQQPAWGFEQIVGGVDDEQGRRRAIRLEPTSDDVRGSARLQILGTTSDGRLGSPVANAFVTLTATVTGVVEPPVYAVSGITDVDGVMVVDFEGSTTSRVPLLRARYAVRVVPPVNTPYTGRQTVIDLTAAQAGFVLDEQVTLPQRTEVRGVVLSGLGRPVTGALVELRPLEADNRPADTITEYDGRFRVSLDPGAYLAVIQPRGLTDAQELVPVTAHRIDVPAAQAIDLDPLAAAHGQSLRLRVDGGREGAPVAGTRVELFMRVEDQTVSLGRAETDAGGYFEATVPRPAP